MDTLKVACMAIIIIFTPINFLLMILNAFDGNYVMAVINLLATVYGTWFIWWQYRKENI